ncbi:MAG: hypothetical protein EP298_04930 [Gammaproteobacteria bacterium]|nr:MAG: hypothetical protein EP298_04930 [Gammaproteobacteria bacterium]UTW42526.1 hypothetical protein KFE69_13825 [bacterium SCSIO 12844]
MLMLWIPYTLYAGEQEYTFTIKNDTNMVLNFVGYHIDKGSITDKNNNIKDIQPNSSEQIEVWGDKMVSWSGKTEAEGYVEFKNTSDGWDLDLRVDYYADNKTGGNRDKNITYGQIVEINPQYQNYLKVSPTNDSNQDNSVVTITQSTQPIAYKLNDIGLGKMTIKVCGRDGKVNSDGTVYIACPIDDYGKMDTVMNVYFTNTSKSCSIHLDVNGNVDDIYCDQNAIGYNLNDNKHIISFLCQQTEPGSGQCPWAIPANNSNSKMAPASIYG